MADTKGTGAAPAKKRDRSGETREHFDGLVIKNTPSKTKDPAKAKIQLVNGTDVDTLVEFIKKSLAQARGQDDTIKYVKGTLTLS
jgi:PDZ domain-containing secreted protein